MRRIPPLNALVAFDAVARSGSMSAAARELGRTHGAVSQQMKKLQEDIGAQLVARSGRGIHLTETGRALHLVVGQSLDRIEAGIQAIRRQSADSTVRLGISPTLALKWLMPSLTSFSQDHPKIALQLSLTGRDHLTLNDHDIILSYDRLTWDDRDKRDFEVIGDVAFGLVMSPVLPMTRTVHGARVPVALHREGHAPAWAKWQELAGVTVDWDTERHFPQTAILVEAAASAQGAAIVERRLVADDLASGRLVAPFGFVRIPDGFAALVAPATLRKPSTKVVLSWLRRIAR